MNIHRVFIATEAALLGIPMIMLSGFWLLLMAYNVFEIIQSHAVGVTLIYVHLFLALIAFLSVVSLIYLSFNFARCGCLDKSKKNRLATKFIQSGIAISFIGAAAFLYDQYWELKTDPIQMFSTYVLGMMLWLPAGHILYLFCANNAPKQTQ